MQPTQTQDSFFANAEALETDVINKTEKIASDTRFSPIYKQEEFSKHVSAALAELDSYANLTQKHLEKQIARLTPLIAVQLSPSLEEAAALSYTKDVVMQSWESWAIKSKQLIPAGERNAFGGTASAITALGNLGYVQEIKGAWQAAIASEDKITARVYKDFAENFLRQKQGIPASEELPDSLLFVEELQEQTLDLLRTPEQRKQAAELRQHSYDLSKLRLTAGMTRERLQNAYLDEDGKVRQKATFTFQF